MRKTRKIATEKKNVLVTGGAGFLGSHLCDELVKTSRVICVDNFLTGSEENIHHLEQNSDFRFIRHDFTEIFDPSKFPELATFNVPFQGIQEIYHLASPSAPNDCKRYPIETMLANALGTRNALDLAREYRALFLFVSSSAVYGEVRGEQPISESTWGIVDPTGPLAAYQEGKRFAEGLILHYGKRHEMPVKILRLFSTYGPRMQRASGRMIPTFINAALEEGEYEVPADGTKVSLQYVSDAVEAILKMMQSDEPGPLNIGNPEPLAPAAVAEQIAKIAKSTPRLRETQDPEYSMPERVPDIGLAKERLGWFPVVSLEDGLKRTIEYFKGSKVLRWQTKTESIHE